ncbi:MAG: SDR family oxidoreductase [Muribaculaceae bacterium]|nr:SDR family oxidoreductase [Muribaculaceae bacterium]
MQTIFNPFSLAGKTILVTGASSGIGRETAIACSHMGARLVITARDQGRLSETMALLSPCDGENHMMALADLTQMGDIENLIKDLPPLDGAVLCAGNSTTLPLQFGSREKFDEMFDVNFFAPVELLRLMYKKKVLQKGASVVLIASIGGTHSFMPGNGVYGASKAALNSVMKYAAREYASRKVRVNSICPGMVDTPLIHRGTITEEQLAEDAKKYPLGRYGRPEDIANGAIYLLSDASSWLTGHDLVIDGGFSI